MAPSWCESESLPARLIISADEPAIPRYTHRPLPLPLPRFPSKNLKSRSQPPGTRTLRKNPAASLFDSVLGGPPDAEQGQQRARRPRRRNTESYKNGSEAGFWPARRIRDGWMGGGSGETRAESGWNGFFATLFSFGEGLLSLSRFWF